MSPWRVGGPARFLINAKTEEQIVSAMDFARVHGLSVFILGGGSNIVVSDSGFPGLVIKIELSGIQESGENYGKISAAAGVEWESFVRHCADSNLAGVECLSGIPGTVGGAPIQNIGAYGEEVSEVISGIRTLDRNSQTVIDLNNADCKFTYRSSIFNTVQRNRYVILVVDFALRTDGNPRIHYPDLQKRFSGSKHVPTIKDVREAVLRIRESKAMVLRDNDPDSKSAGSFFRNPVLNSDVINAVETKARANGILGSTESIPRFPAAVGKEKLPAAWLIEHAGFHKGYTRGNAGISSKHALALINRGGASAGDILELMNMIQDRVYKLFEVQLLPEPEFVGF